MYILVVIKQVCGGRFSGAISVGGPELCTFQLTIAVLVLPPLQRVKNWIISGIQPSLKALASSDSEC